MCSYDRFIARRKDPDETSETLCIENEQPSTATYYGRSPNRLKIIILDSEVDVDGRGSIAVHRQKSLQGGAPWLCAKSSGKDTNRPLNHKLTKQGPKTVIEKQVRLPFVIHDIFNPRLS
jgi:hypothetical protein